MSGYHRPSKSALLAVAAAATTVCALLMNLVVVPPVTEAAVSETDGVPTDARKGGQQAGAVLGQPVSANDPADAHAEHEILQASFVAIPSRGMEELLREQPQQRDTRRRLDAATASVEEDASRYPDIPSAPFSIRATMSPLAQALHHQQMREEAAARRERQFAESLRKIRERQKVWQGTMAELSQHPDVTMVERLSAARFVKLFESDPPAPEVRKQHFAAFFEPDAEQRCVSWRLALKSAREVDDGWLVDLEAHVNLLGPGFAISFGNTKEVWHVSHDHELTFVEGSPDEDKPAQVDCRP